MQIKKAILKNNIDENDVKFYENFDIGQIENERNELSGEFGLFEKKIDENELWQRVVCILYLITTEVVYRRCFYSLLYIILNNNWGCIRESFEE